MSTFISPSISGNSIGFNIVLNEDRLQPPEYKLLGREFYSQIPADFADILWPRSHQFGFTSSAGGILNILNPDPAAQAWEWNVYTTGSRHRMVFTGITLDAAGNPLGGCTVQLFNTATGQIVDTQISDPKGNYKCTDPNNVACFLVAYLPGSPDVTGATVDELTGT